MYLLYVNSTFHGFVVESKESFDLMLVYRLTDDNVRRTDGKRDTPLIPSAPRIERDPSQVNHALLEWMIRYESYRL